MGRLDTIRDRLLHILMAVLLLTPGAQAIQQERPGVLERVSFHYDDPDVALWSFAHPNVDGCSGTMVGPQTLMTAGHCGGAEKTATFIVYGPNGTRPSESVSCTYLAHTFPDSDIRLLHCPLDADGVALGDKYGYLDFDIARWSDGRLHHGLSRLMLEDAELYSIWRNPVAFDASGNPAPGGDHRLYSEGVVTAMNDRAWYTPNYVVPELGDYSRCDSDSDPSLNRNDGIASDVWGMSGASGSTSLSRLTHRVLLGPLSLAQTSEAPARQQLSIADYLYFGYLEPLIGTQGCAQGVIPPVNEAHLTDVGVTDPSRFYGWLDDDLDGLFDVQHEVELVQGEVRKDWHWLGFESARRNALWNRGSTATVEFDTGDPRRGVASIDARSDASSVTALSHGLLHLRMNRDYRVTLEARVQDAGSGSPLQVCIGVNCRTPEIEAGAGWRRVVAELSGDSAITPPFGDPIPWNPLRIVAGPGSQLEIANVSVIEVGAVMDFDSHAKRFAWNDGHGKTGLVWPHGNGDSSAQPDWAGVVRREGAADMLPLRNDDLGVPPGDYQVCFSHRASEQLGNVGFEEAQVRVWDRETGYVAPGSNVRFSPGGTWQDSCTGRFGLDGEQNVLMFGFTSTAAADAGYLVDDIRFEDCADVDGDGICEARDNCPTVANADQANADGDAHGDACDLCVLVPDDDAGDADTDGFGDLCDADYDQNSIVGISDFGMFAGGFGSSVNEPGYIAILDHDANGVVGIGDFGVITRSFGGAPGPSGLGCAGTMPCVVP
jgi:hypothetical protein